MTYRKSYQQRTPWTLGLLLGLVILSLSWLDGRAAAATNNAPRTVGESNVAGVLNADGTLRAGASGSFNVRGYQMEYTATGAPRFVPAAAAQAGCVGWDTQFNANVNESVYAMLLVGDNLYLGGQFTVAGGVAANRVARYNLATNTWSALGSGGGNGVDRFVQALAMIGNDLYVGGDFSQANVGGAAVSVQKLAKYNTVTNTWSRPGNGVGVSAAVNTMVASGSDLFVGGSFIEAYAGGTALTANRVAKYSTTTNIWSKLGWGDGTGVNGNVLALAVIGSDVYVGGDFDRVNWGGVNWSTQHYVVRYSLTTNTWNKLGSGNSGGVNATVRTLLAVGADLYLGGDFHQANMGVGTTIFPTRVAKYDTTTNTFSTLGGSGNGINGTVYTLAMRGSNLYVGGNFSEVIWSGGSLQTGAVAKYNTTTGAWAKLEGDIKITTSVFALSAGVSHLYVGGRLTLISGGTQTLVYAGRVCYENGCDAILSKTGQNFAATGGTGDFTVTIDGACQWTAVSNDPSFITVTAPAGTVAGTQTVSFSVASHTNSAPRSGTITVAGLTFIVRQGAQFTDVPVGAQFYEEIGKLSAVSITQGCSSGNYCPDSNVSRDQMAAFLSRALGVFNPPTPASQRFADVPSSNAFYAFIEEIAVRQITLGCGGGNYCPTAFVSREQMAAFIIRALHEPGYVPPTNVPQRFNDVPSSNAFYGHIEEMAVRGITLGCGGGNYCPTDNVTRAAMAAFLVRAFNL